MSEENQNNLPKEIPSSYYQYGHPDRVIDRVAKLAKLNGDPHLQNERQQLVREVLTFCPVPFLDELIEALISKTQEATKTLRDKASRNELNLRFNHISSNEEKNQISALALKLLSEKIMSADSEKILPILRFIQEYIKVQLDYQDLVFQEIAELQEQKDWLTKEIQIKEQEGEEIKRVVFIDFVGKLSSLDS